MAEQQHLPYLVPPQRRLALHFAQIVSSLLHHAYALASAYFSTIHITLHHVRCKHTVGTEPTAQQIYFELIKASPRSSRSMPWQYAHAHQVIRFWIAKVHRTALLGMLFLFQHLYGALIQLGQIRESRRSLAE